MALDSGSSSDAVVSRPAVPAGVRIASTLAWVVGVLTIVGAVAIGVPGLTGFDVTLVPFVVNLIAGIGVCAAAYLVRRQRRVGALLVVLAWALPTITSLLSHQTPRGGNFLLFAAMLMLLANWKHLH